MTDHGTDYDNTSGKVDDSRKGNWMQVFSGRQFYPLDPRPEEIDITDIAHALSLQCRYAGHCLNFYSVAEHSYHMSHIVPPEHALTGLLHDATEAYCIDIIRPLKPHLPGHAEIEANLWSAIAARYGLPPVMPDVVKHYDTAILHAEREQNMFPTDHDWSLPPEKPDVEIHCWDPPVAKRMFLERFMELYTAE